MHKTILLAAILLSACIEPSGSGQLYDVNTPTFDPGPPGGAEAACKNARHEILDGAETLVLDLNCPGKVDTTGFALFLSSGPPFNDQLILHQDLKCGNNVLVFPSTIVMVADEIVNPSFDLLCN